MQKAFGEVFSAAETGVRSLRPSDMMTACKHTYGWGRAQELPWVLCEMI